MATRGWQDVTMADINKQALAKVPKASKYRNVKTVVNGIPFDSKREADYYTLLLARSRNGEIFDLQLQQPFDLACPDKDAPMCSVVVARYVADFTYRDPAGVLHIVDAKGHRTALYKLKSKWLYLQKGYVIEEV